MSILAQGQVFEQYRVLQILGETTSGESYEVEDLEHQRKAMLKLLHPWGRLPEATVRLFFREIQGIGSLQHPYLAHLFNCGEVDGQLYVARRYVSTGTLLSNKGRAWFQPPFNPTSAIQFAHQLAECLQIFHAKGFVHGALTMNNILVLRTSHTNPREHFAPFLISDVGLTHFIRRFGQPRNPLLPITAAPEQFKQRATFASDQYALAVIAYYWLAGQPPFLGSPTEIEEQKLHEQIPSLLSQNRLVTSQQDSVIRRALSVYPEDRYPSISHFTSALLATLIKETPRPEKTVVQRLPTQPVRPTNTNIQIPSRPSAQPKPTSASDKAFEKVIAQQLERTEFKKPVPAAPQLDTAELLLLALSQKKPVPPPTPPPPPVREVPSPEPVAANIWVSSANQEIARSHASALSLSIEYQFTQPSGPEPEIPVTNDFDLEQYYAQQLEMLNAAIEKGEEE